MRRHLAVQRQQKDAPTNQDIIAAATRIVMGALA